MSKTHGDKARFAKQRHSKLLRRKRLRELSKPLSLEDKPGTIQDAPVKGKHNKAVLGGQSGPVQKSVPPAKQGIKS